MTEARVEGDLEREILDEAFLNLEGGPELAHEVVVSLRALRIGNGLTDKGLLLQALREAPDDGDSEHRPTPS